MPEPQSGLIGVDMELGQVVWHADCKFANMDAFLDMMEGIDRTHHR